MTTIEFRTGPYGYWVSSYEVPARGEMCIDEDTGAYKLGDGETLWVELPYYGTLDEALKRQLIRIQGVPLDRSAFFDDSNIFTAYRQSGTRIVYPRPGDLIRVYENGDTYMAAEGYHNSRDDTPGNADNFVQLTKHDTMHYAGDWVYSADQILPTVEFTNFGTSGSLPPGWSLGGDVVPIVVNIQQPVYVGKDPGTLAEGYRRDEALPPSLVLGGAILGPDQETYVEFTVDLTGLSSRYMFVKVFFDTEYDLDVAGSTEYNITVDGSVVDSSVDQVGWYERAYELSAGPHTVRMTYRKIGDPLPLGGNAVYISRVSYDNFDVVQYRPYDVVVYQGASYVLTGTDGSETPGTGTEWELLGRFDPPTFQPSTTVARPSAVTAGVGAMYYDTTLGKPGYSDGAVWRDASGTAI